nr:MAG TPA: hypothetical protein [Caudoviricetes sp.]DAL97267.1 MAG TPA: hypothetical protein [Caudoviricetes sp.]
MRCYFCATKKPSETSPRAKRMKKRNTCVSSSG